MVKKMLSVLMVLMLLFVQGSVVAEGDTIHLTFWHSMSENAAEALQSLVDAYNGGEGKAAGVEVETVYQGSYTDAVTKMTSLISANQLNDLPDVMQMDATGKVLFAATDAAYTVDDAMAEQPDNDLSMMIAPAMMNWNLAGRQLGLPFATSTNVTYYNKTALDAEGLGVPTSLEGLVAMAEKHADPAVALYADVPNTPTLANWLGGMGSYLVDQANGTAGTATMLDCVENGKLAEFLTLWKKLYTVGALKNEKGSSDTFVGGSQLIYNNSSSGFVLLTKKIGGAFELGVAPYMAATEGGLSAASTGGSSVVLFRHDAARQAAAWSFVRYLTGAEAQADFAASTGYLPANRLAVETEAWKNYTAVNPQVEVMMHQLLNTPDTMRSVTIGPSADFYYAIQNNVTDMLDNDIDPAEAAQTMADDLNGLLQQYLKSNPGK